MQPVKASTARIVVGVCVIGWLAFIAAGIQHPAASVSPSAGVDTRPPVPPVPDWRDSVFRHMSLSFTWVKSGFGTVMLATLRFKNAGDVEIRDVEITCIGSGESGTAIDRTVRTAYVRVPAHKTTVVRDLNMGLINAQVTSESCSVTDFSVD